MADEKPLTVPGKQDSDFRQDPLVYSPPKHGDFRRDPMEFYPPKHGDFRKDPLVYSPPQHGDFRQLGDMPRSPDKASIVDSLLGDSTPGPVEPGPPSLVDSLLDAKPTTPPIGFIAEHGLKKSPEQASSILKNATATGLSEDLVERNLEEVERRKKVASFEELTKSSPFLSSWLSENPNHVAVAQDDLDNLKETERHFQDYSFAAKMWDSLRFGFETAKGVTAKTPAFSKAFTDTVGPYLPAPMRAAFKASGLISEQVDSPELVASLERSAENFRVPELDREVIATAMQGNATEAAKILAIKATSQIPQLVPVILSSMMGAPGLGLSFMGATSGADKYSTETKEGTDQATAVASGVAFGAAEMLWERYGLFKVFGAWEDALSRNVGKAMSREVIKDFGKTLAFSFMAEGKSEALTEFSQAFADFALRTDPEPFKNIASRMGESFLLGGTLGVGLTSPAAIATATARQADVARANQAKNFYTSLGSTAEASKLRERLPEAQKQIVEKIVKDSPVENIYIPVEKFDEYFQSKEDESAAGISQKLGINESYEEARQSGGNVKVPLSTWVEKVVGTPHYNGLANDIKFNEDELTVNEAKTVQEELKASLEQTETESTQEQDPSQAIENDVVKQLLAAGYDEQSASTSAKVLKAFTVAGKRLGVDPQELYDRYRLRVASQEPGQGQAAQELNQAVINMPRVDEKDYTYDEVLQSARNTGNDADRAALGDLYGKTRPTFRRVEVPVSMLARWFKDNVKQERPTGKMRFEAGPEDEKWAQKFAKKFASGATAEPILVQNQGGMLKILDGRHRARAAFLRGEPTVQAFIANEPDPVNIDAIRAKFRTVTPEEFVTARAQNPRSTFLSPTPPTDLASHRLFLSEDGVGFAIAPDGDIQGVFNNSPRKGAGQEAIILALNEGGKKLDCFGDFLPYYYNSFGFKLTRSDKWDDTYAPEGWDYEKHGRPDIVYMEFEESLTRDAQRLGTRFQTSWAENSRRYSDAGQRRERGDFSWNNDLIDWAKRGEGNNPEPGAPSDRVGVRGQGLELNQSILPAIAPFLSPLGFYSAVEKAVSEMDFKEMPAKDLASRIQNLQGVKKDELTELGLIPWLQAKDAESQKGPITSYEVGAVKDGEWKPLSTHTDMDFAQQERDYQAKSPALENAGFSVEIREVVDPNDGRVTKEEVLQFIRDNGLQIEQVVKAEDFGGFSDQNGNASTQTNWGELEVQPPDDYAVGDEQDYLLENIEDYFESELNEAMANEELRKKHTDSDGKLDEEALKEAAIEELQNDDGIRQRAWDRAYESYTDPDSGNARFTVTDEETGWSLEGSDEYGWYNSETGQNFETSLEEAKVRLFPFMIRDGVLAGEISDYVQAEDIKFDVAGKLPSDATMKRNVKRLLKENPDQSKQWYEEEYRDSYEFYDFEDVEAERKERAERRAKKQVERRALEEVTKRYEDPSNKRNQITIKIKHPLLKGYTVQGNAVTGFRLLKGGGPRTSSVLADFEVKTVEEAQAEAIKALKEHGVVNRGEPEKPGEQATQVDPNKPTGSSKWERYVVPGGENYREFIITLPKSLETFRHETHWGSLKNPLMHFRVTDRVVDGKKTLFVEELQSDWHQQGRERGYSGETSNPETIALIAEAKKYIPGLVPRNTSTQNLEDAGAPAELTAKWFKLVQSGELGEGVANAPFKNTDAWATFAMKRIIRLAVEQGYDQVAWTGGEVHVDRWGTDSVSWVKKEPSKDQVKVIEAAEDRFTLVTGPEGNQRFIGNDTWNSKEEAQREADALNAPHWLVGSVEQVGGRAGGVNIEEAARNRGKLLEQRGERVTSKEQLRKVIADTLNRERNERSLEALTESIWKQMQEKDSGVKAPRKEGMEFFYDNVLPKKVAPAILKKLDKSVQVKSEEMPTGDTTATYTWEGKNYTAEELKAYSRSDKAISLDDLDRAELQELIRKVELGKPFNEAIVEGGFSDIAPRLEGVIRRTEKPVTKPIHKFELTEEVKKKAMEGFTLFQKDPSDAARGSVKFGAETLISLGKNKNLSTFLHEMGHVYLELLGDISEIETRKNAALGVKGPAVSDYETVLKWLGVESRDQIGREHHEKFARGFEAYLMEGKAPSEELRTAFARFRAWLLDIYKNSAALFVNVSPEVKAVFDRLLATEEEIDAAQKSQGMTPLFPDPQGVGMTADEAARYSQGINEAKLEAESQLATKLMRELKRTEDAKYQARREQVRTEVELEVADRPEQVALSVLQRGELPNGASLPESLVGGFGAGNLKAIKLSKAAIVEQFGKERLSKLPKPYVYSREGGTHPDVAAPMFGYNSGDELLTAIESAPKFDTEVERITDERMKEEFGDLLTDGLLPEEAMRAVHSEKRAQLLRKELEILARQDLPAMKGLIRKLSKRIPTLPMVRAQAESLIARKQVQDIQPITYQRAERKAAREAISLFLKGDIEGAFNAKQKELLNHELYRAATEAQEQVEKTVDYMNKFAKPTVRERMGKAGGEYLEQIETLLARFDFRQRSLKALDKRKSLLAFVQEQAAQGLSVDVPETLLNEARRQNYQQMSYQDLLELRSTVESIEHLARLKLELLANEKTRQVEEAVSDIVGSIAASHDLTDKPVEIAPGLKDKILDKFKSLAAIHTRMEFLFEFLDGNKDLGPVWQHLFKPFVDAENAENARMKEVVAKLTSIFGAYSKKERSKWLMERIYFPELKTHLTKANMLVIALNWGNEYNRSALMEGYGWNERQVQLVLDRLDERDWKTVAAVWEYVDSFWPEIAALEKKLNGVAPQKVQPTEVVTKFGRFNGGYYPIVFDSKLSWKQAVLEEKASVQEMFGGNWARAMTRNGHTKERQGTGGKPLLLELSGLTNHLSNVVHDLTHRPAVIDVSKLLGHKQVRQAIELSAGKEMYRQLHGWLQSIASDRRTESANAVERLLGRARSGATVVNMGFKLTTTIVQFSGYLQTAKEIGVEYAGRGLHAMFARPGGVKRSWNFVLERSQMMQDRVSNHDRDIRDAMKNLQIAGAAANPLARNLPAASTYFQMIGFADMLVSIPSWLGAYEKAMDGKVEGLEKGNEATAIDYADKVIRQTQGAGGMKDLANVQRGSEIQKLFTMFYSFYGVLFNQFQKVKSQQGFERNTPQLLASLALIWFIPAVLDDLILGRGPGDDDDEEEWLKWFAKKEAMYPFGSVILLRDVVNGMDKYGYNPSPAFDAIESLSKTGSTAVKLLTGEKDEIERSDVKGTIMTTGYLLKLPTRQVWLTGEYFYDWLTGNQEPENPAQGVWQGLVTGKPKRK